MLFAALALHFSLCQATAQSSKEYQLKAVCLWRLAQFTDWPTNAFENSNSPIIIGVLGENPFADSLDLAVRGETAHGRKLVVQQYGRFEECKGCHVLFISRSEARRVNQITAALAGSTTLTVSDIDQFTRSHGGMVELVTELNRIKLRIDVAAVSSARLSLDARVLRAAEIVKRQ